MTNGRKTENNNLWLLRHAKSDWNSGVIDDFARPLNRRGKRDAPRIGRFMARQGWFPDTVIASPATRVRQTVKRVCRELVFDLQRVHWDRRLYEAEVADLLDVLRNCREKNHRVLLVGHNPGLEELLVTLCGRIMPSDDGKLLPTAALAYLEIFSPWAALEPGRARLLRIVRPRDLPAEV